MLGKIVAQITNLLIKNGNIDGDDYDVYYYSIEVLFIQLIGFASIIIFSFMFSILLETMVYILLLFVCRNICGGYHANTHSKCYLLTLLFYFLFAIILKFPPSSCMITIVFLLMFINTITICFLAPVDSKNNRLTSAESCLYRKKARLLVLSLCILSMFLLVLQPYWAFVCALSVFQEAISLLMGFAANLKAGGEQNENSYA